MAYDTSRSNLHYQINVGWAGAISLSIPWAEQPSAPLSQKLNIHTNTSYTTMKFVISVYMYKQTNYEVTSLNIALDIK